MSGFTYDDESYADADLDAWIVAVGELLREQGEGGAKPKPAEPKPAEPKPAEPKPAAKAAAAKPRAKPKPKSDG